MRPAHLARHALGLTLSTVLTSPAHALDFDFYASARVALEVVEPDNQAPLDNYVSWRDAYSRIGFNASHAIDDSATVYGKLELPLDIPNGEVQYAYDQREDIRVAKIGVKGAFGDLAFGQMWLPYYNAIAYPVDMFSSYYSGFATFTTFRQEDTVAYYTPSFGAFSAGFAWSKDDGAGTAGGGRDDRLQATVSYSNDGLTLSGGIDHLGGVNDSSILGTSLMWQANDALFIGAKAERFHSDAAAGFGADGDMAVNLYAGYTVGKNTFKGMIADVDKFGERVIHLGVDHQYSKDLKFFAEFYHEQETAAITAEKGGLRATCFACNGGYVGLVGVRYDFSAP